MVGPGMFDGIGTMITVGFIATVMLFVVLVYEIVDVFFIEEKIESTTILIPEIKLTTDGKNIDTIYIYKKK